jgi:hypothetical protein
MLKYKRRFLDEAEFMRRWRDPRLETVRVEGICHYLRQKGWTEVPTDRNNFLVFREPDSDADHPLYQFIPDGEDDDMYVPLIRELMAALAAIEDRYAGDVLTDILRCHNAITSNGSPSAPTAAETIAR